MQVKEAIILAGGLGTRLRSAVPDLPKCMAPVAGRPFVSYLLDYFIKQGIERFIFSLGYKYEVIQEFLDTEYPSLNKTYSVEPEPLGTGGAIKLALAHVNEENVLILNGDTFFAVNVEALALLHSTGAACTLSLKPMLNFDRYGVVELNTDSSVKAFREKQFYQKGVINGGVYVLNTAAFFRQELPEKFSFEKDFLEVAAAKQGNKLFGLVQDRYFIDIGIPEDFERAQTELLTNLAVYE